MKLKHIAFFLFILSIFTSCEKDEDNGMDFKITGIRDTVIERGQSFTLPLKVFYLGGTKEKVTISSSGNGNGVSISYSPNVGEPNYDLTQTITASALADTGFYTVTVTGISESKKQFSKSFQLHVTDVANSAPVIFLNQGDTVVHTLNSQWFDPGFTATDPEDGNITAQVQITGTVNVNQMALYTLTYTVTDSDGLTVTAKRVVNVQNSVSFISGQYTCTTITTGFPTQIWITSLSASTTVNNRFRIFKIGNLFQADPDVTFDPSNDSIYLATQTFTAISPNDTLQHTFLGRGKVTYSSSSSAVGVELTYTDTYIDPNTGLQVVLNKRDIYNK